MIPITFHIFKGDQVVRAETITENVIKIGRLESSQLRIDDENVSRMHSVIEIAGPDEIHIIDLGSTSGTVVNGRKVNKIKLQTGDELVLGNTRIIVEIGAGDDYQDAAAVPIIAQPAEQREQPEYEQPAQYSEPRQQAPGFRQEVPGFQPPASAPRQQGAFQPAMPFPSPFASPAGGGAAFANPFAAPAPQMFGDYAQGSRAGSTFHEENVQYQIVASGPPINPAEIDTAEPAVEVTVLWGDTSVLHVEHLSPPRSYYVGDATDAKGKPATDYLIGSESLGTERLPVVVELGAGVAVVIPNGAYGDVTVGQQRMTIEELAANNQLHPCTELAGAWQFPLPAGATARIVYRNFTFIVKPGSAARRVGIGGRPEFDWAGHIWTLLSAALMLLMLIMFYFLPPNATSLSLELLSADSRLIKYLIEAPELVEEEMPEWLLEDDKESGKGKRHKDEEGQMGDKNAKKTNNKFGIEGPKENEDP
ncbi:MAG: FHA domain-containing protein, partial [Deltaproteobacteria bacterium]|nr:FHA domain-containing protein [Deltaproteobacteria bacterium]